MEASWRDRGLAEKGGGVKVAADDVSRIKLEKLDECIEGLVAELEEAVKRNAELSKALSARDELVDSLRGKSGDVAFPDSHNAAYDKYSIGQSSTTRPSPGVDWCDRKKIETLQQQLKTNEASYQETVTGLMRKHNRERGTLQSRLRELERSNVVLSASRNSASPSTPTSPMPLAAADIVARKSSTNLSERSKPRRGASCDSRQKTRARTPSARPGISEADPMEKTRAQVDRTLAKVSALLKHIAEGEKKGKSDLSGYRKPLTAAQQELSASRQSLSECEKKPPSTRTTPHTKYLDDSASQAKSAARNVSPRVPASSQRLNKAPIPPLSLTELRMRSPRLQQTPKSQYLSQPLSSSRPVHLSASVGTSRPSEMKAKTSYKDPTHGVRRGYGVSKATFLSPPPTLPY
ncbi:hypothetical protein DIPPA_16366 [Diplonema papillatum]|nr:hypothetical protein DIPPA_16366 [Diplonema papillatum]KAJ9468685.1 hypothetical protein DIPPA_16366 [Diplonema papillatum]